MSDNQVISTKFTFQLDGDQAVLRAVNSLSKGEKDLKANAESANKAMENIAKSQAAFRTVQTHIKTLGTDVENTTELVEGLEGAVSELKRQEAVIALARHFAAVAKETGDANHQAEVLLATLRRIGATGAEIDNARAAFNAFSSDDGKGKGGKNFAPLIQRAAGSLGLGPVAEVAGIVDDVGELGGALAEAGVSTTFLTGAAVGAGVAAVGLGIAVKVFSDNAEKGKTAVDAATNSVKVYYETVRTLTTEQAREQLEIVKRNQQDINDELNTLISSRDRAFTELAQKNPVGDLGARIQTLFDGFRGGDAQMASVNERIKTLQAESGNAAGEIAGLERALHDGSLEANDAATALEAHNEQLERQSQLIANQVSEAASQQLRVNKEIAALEGQSAEQLSKKQDSLKQDIAFQAQYIKTLESTGEPSEQLDAQINSAYLEMQVMTSVLKYLETGVIGTTKAAEEYKKSLDEANKAADEYAANSRKLIDLQSQQSDIAAKRARDDSRTAQIASFETKIAAAKEIEAEQQRASKVVSLRQKAVADEIASQNRLRDESAKLNVQFMQNELKELRSFQKEELRADAAHKLARSRTLEDLYDDLSSLAAKGEISAFIEAQQQGIKALRRSDEDAGIASNERTEDYAEGVRQREEERRLRLADLQQSFFEERVQRQDQLRAQIEQEQAAGKQRILQSAQLQEQLSALREQWAQEDLIRTRREEDQQLANQIAAVRKRNDELKPILTKALDPAITSVKNFASSVADNLVNMYNRVRAAAAGASRPVTNTRGVAHALGEIYTQPTVQMSAVAEVPGYGDMVVPFRQSEGVLPALEKMLSKAGGSRGGLTINHLEIKAGSIATPEDLALLRSEVLGGLEDAAQVLGASGVTYAEGVA